MTSQINISQGMRLDQKLSAQTVLNSEILQMTSLELETAIQQELETNPLLEMDESVESDVNNEYDSEYKGDSYETGFLDTHEKNNDLNWDDYFKEGFKNSEPEDFSKRDPDEDDWEKQQTYDLDVEKYLESQLKDRNLKDKVKECVMYLIGCIGDNGFLSDYNQLNEINSINTKKKSLIKEIDLILKKEKPLEKAHGDVKEAFRVLRSLEPVGIGAFDLHDCLVMQAKRIENFPQKTLEILEHHYDLLLNLRYIQIAKLMDMSVQEVNNAIKQLSVLNPYPLSKIPVSNLSYITPDFLVERDSTGSFFVSLREGMKSKLKINDSYKSLLKTKNVDNNEKNWIRNKLNSANVFIRSVDSRKETMMLVMNAILRRQYDFFARGKQHLKPMILQDIANEVNRDVSTVNRVTNGKYVQTPYGVFELKQFFSTGIAQEDGTEVSSVKIKESIRNIINEENKKSPFSDQEISAILEKRGLKVARRTVNKYREAMGILPVKIRRNV